MDVKKAIKLYKAGMKFGDIRELCDLTQAQMYVVDYGVTNRQADWKVVESAGKVDDAMLSTEIESLFSK